MNNSSSKLQKLIDISQNQSLLIKEINDSKGFILEEFKKNNIYPTKEFLLNSNNIFSSLFLSNNLHQYSLTNNETEIINLSLNQDINFSNLTEDEKFSFFSYRIANYKKVNDDLCFSIPTINNNLKFFEKYKNSYQCFKILKNTIKNIQTIDEFNLIKPELFSFDLSLFETLDEKLLKDPTIKKLFREFNSNISFYSYRYYYFDNKLEEDILLFKQILEKYCSYSYFISNIEANIFNLNYKDFISNIELFNIDLNFISLFSTEELIEHKEDIQNTLYNSNKNIINYLTTPELLINILDQNYLKKLLQNNKFILTSFSNEKLYLTEHCFSLLLDFALEEDKKLKENESNFFIPYIFHIINKNSQYHIIEDKYLNLFFKEIDNQLKNSNFHNFNKNIFFNSNIFEEYIKQPERININLFSLLNVHKKNLFFHEHKNSKIDTIDLIENSLMNETDPVKQKSNKISIEIILNDKDDSFLSSSKINHFIEDDDYNFLSYKNFAKTKNYHLLSKINLYKNDLYLLLDNETPLEYSTFNCIFNNAIKYKQSKSLEKLKNNIHHNIDYIKNNKLLFSRLLENTYQDYFLPIDNKDYYQSLNKLFMLIKQNATCSNKINLIQVTDFFDGEEEDNNVDEKPLYTFSELKKLTIKELNGENKFSYLKLLNKIKEKTYNEINEISLPYSLLSNKILTLFEEKKFKDIKKLIYLNIISIQPLFSKYLSNLSFDKFYSNLDDKNFIFLLDNYFNGQYNLSSKINYYTANQNKAILTKLFNLKPNNQNNSKYLNLFENSSLIEIKDFLLDLFSCDLLHNFHLKKLPFTLNEKDIITIFNHSEKNKKRSFELINNNINYDLLDNLYHIYFTDNKEKNNDLFINLLKIAEIENKKLFALLYLFSIHSELYIDKKTSIPLNDHHLDNFLIGLKELFNDEIYTDKNKTKIFYNSMDLFFPHNQETFLTEEELKKTYLFFLEHQLHLTLGHTYYDKYQPNLFKSIIPEFFNHKNFNNFFIPEKTNNNLIYPHPVYTDKIKEFSKILLNTAFEKNEIELIKKISYNLQLLNYFNSLNLNFTTEVLNDKYMSNILNILTEKNEIQSIIDTYLLKSNINEQLKIDFNDYKPKKRNYL